MACSIPAMPIASTAPKSSPPAASPQRAPEPDPAGQSPEEPIKFANTDVGRGNEERANAEPEPAALHDADVPGVPDPAEKRRSS
jgi:hypothetical protein